MCILFIFTNNVAVLIGQANNFGHTYLQIKDLDRRLIDAPCSQTSVVPLFRENDAIV